MGSSCRRLAQLLGIAMLLPMAPSAVLAQDPADVTMAHPMVGAWFLDVTAEDSVDDPVLVIFHGDGTYIQPDDEVTGIGAWVPTGDRTADVTIHWLFQDPETGAKGISIARGSFGVAEEGSTLEGDYNMEFIGPDGQSSGEIGPVRATAVRVAVEAMGDPVAGPEAMLSDAE